MESSGDLKTAKQIHEEYVPVDFDAYSILDKQTQLNQFTIDRTKPLDKEERIWRISSLTTLVDDETKILVLPVPESRRATRIIDTRYSYSTYKDLIEKAESIEKELQTKKEEAVVRFEDKTQEERQNDMKKKRRQQLKQMTNIRTYQMGFMFFGIFFYMFVYRKFLAGKSVMNSVIYH